MGKKKRGRRQRNMRVMVERGKGGNKGKPGRRKGWRKRIK